MTAPRRFPTWLNGTLHAAGEARISTDDAGFLLGLSVFETVLFEGDTVYFLEAHLSRLDEGMRALEIKRPLPFDPARVVRAYARSLGESFPGDPLALRITVTRGVPGRDPSIVLGARDVIPPPAGGAKVAVARNAKVASDALESVKSTDRARNVLLRERGGLRGAFETLLCTEDGDVSEGTLSNVFAVIDGTLVTPSLARGALAGIMRGVILEEMRRARHPIEEGRLEEGDLARASEVFLSNTTGRAIAVAEVEGVVAALPAGRGPVYRAVSERIRAREAAYRASAPRD